MANSMTFMRKARAPRKTMVIGTVSDYSGKGGEIHRKVARLALEAAIGWFLSVRRRTMSIGCAGVTSGDRLFAFVTSHQAAAFLAEAPLPGN